MNKLLKEIDRDIKACEKMIENNNKKQKELNDKINKMIEQLKK